MNTTEYPDSILFQGNAYPFYRVVTGPYQDGSYHQSVHFEDQMIIDPAAYIPTLGDAADMRDAMWETALGFVNQVLELRHGAGHKVERHPSHHQASQLYHRLDRESATKILTSGFTDDVATFGTDYNLRGVWFSEYPLGAPECRGGNAVLEVTSFAHDVHLKRFEWVRSDLPYREWFIPSALINGRWHVRLLTVTEEMMVLDRFEKHRAESHSVKVRNPVCQ